VAAMKSLIAAGAWTGGRERHTGLWGKPRGLERLQILLLTQGPGPRLTLGGCLKGKVCGLWRACQATKKQAEVCEGDWFYTHGARGQMR